MSKIRVYDLAKELGIDKDVLLERLHAEGFAYVTSTSKGLEEADAETVRKLYEGQVVTSDKPAKAPAKKKTPAKTEKDPAKTEKAQAKKTTKAPAKKKETPAKTEKATAKKTEAKEVVVAEVKEEAPIAEPQENKVLQISTPITVADLAEKMNLKAHELVRDLMMMSIFATINQSLDKATVEKVCQKLGFTFEEIAPVVKVEAVKPKAAHVAVPQSQPSSKKNKNKNKKKGGNDNLSNEDGTITRPPVIVFMGHVDHGKTSLQDYIRNTRVTAREAGGITQHIGASVVSYGGKTLTFLDTPGHEAFTAMRARGANVTDIAVLVVAADDGVMPQTIEAINHARSAGVPIVVAMNKIDKPQANPEKVLIGLQRQNIQVEEWGGDVGVVRVSALTGEGTDELLERLLLEAEMLELNADTNAPLQGQVLEAQLETGMGPTCSTLVREGTIKVGDIVVSGIYYGRIKALIDGSGARIKSAGPSTPVKIMGLNGVPDAGDDVIVVSDEKTARQITEERNEEKRNSQLSVSRKMSLDDLFNQITEDNKKELRIIVKSDVKGSLEAITAQIGKLETEVSHKILLNVIHGSVGEIGENDVLLAAASDAVLLGFNVKAMPEIRRIAKVKGVDLRLYSIIYELLEDLENAILGKLDPELKESILGKAEIVQIFESSKAGRICGCRVTEGLIRVGAKAQVFRDHEQIYNGLIKSLKRFKDDAKEVRQGFECGIRLDNFEEFEEGDIIKVFSVEKVAGTL